MYFSKILRLIPTILAIYYFMPLDAQIITISGKVTLADGPLAGVNVKAAAYYQNKAATYAHHGVSTEWTGIEKKEIK